MIVLPNSFERYLSSLRILVSLSILKHGVQPKHIKNLKKIFIAEALYNKNSRQSVDISRLCNNLLRSINSINPNFKFSCQINGNFYINKSLFSLFLIEVSRISDNITIKQSENYICVLFNTSVVSFPYLSELGGYKLKTQNKVLAIIPVTKSDTDSVYIESEWEYIFDKFSIVNIYSGVDII